MFTPVRLVDEEFTPVKPVGGFKEAAIGSIGPTIQGVGQALQDIPSPDFGIGKAISDYGTKWSESHPSEVQSFQDIKEHPGQFISESIGSMAGQAGQMGAGAALGHAAGYLAGPYQPIASKVLSTIGAWAPIAAGTYGGVRQTQEEEGKTNIPKALGSTAVSTAIENIGGLKPTQFAKGKLLKEGLESLRGKSVKEAAKVIGKAGVKSGAEESFEEALQTPVEQYGGGQDVTSPKSLAETGFSALAAFPGGAAFGGGRQILGGFPTQENSPVQTGEAKQDDVVSVPTEVPPSVQNEQPIPPISVQPGIGTTATDEGLTDYTSAFDKDLYKKASELYDKSPELGDQFLAAYGKNKKWYDEVSNQEEKIHEIPSESSNEKNDWEEVKTSDNNLLQGELNATHPATFVTSDVGFNPEGVGGSEGGKRISELPTRNEGGRGIDERINRPVEPVEPTGQNGTLLPEHTPTVNEPTDTTSQQNTPPVPNTPDILHGGPKEAQDSIHPTVGSGIQEDIAQNQPTIGKPSEVQSSPITPTTGRAEPQATETGEQTAKEEVSGTPEQKGEVNAPQTVRSNQELSVNKRTLADQGSQVEGGSYLRIKGKDGQSTLTKSEVPQERLVLPDRTRNNLKTKVANYLRAKKHGSAEKQLDITKPHNLRTIANWKEEVSDEELQSIIDEARQSTTRFVQRNKPFPGIKKEAAQRVVDNFTSKMKNLPIKIIVHQTQNEAGRGSNRQIIEAEIKFSPNGHEMIVIAENIKDEETLIKVLREEIVGHYGLRSLLGDDHQKVMDEVEKAAKTNDEFRKAWLEISGRDPNTGEVLNSKAPYFSNQYNRAEIADEVISKLAREGNKSNLFQRIIALIKRILRKIGLYRQAMSKDEMYALLAKAEGELRGSFLDNGTRYSISPEDSVALDKKYFNALKNNDIETAQQLVIDAAENAGVPILDEDGVSAYKVRRESPPKKTVKAYKLFRVKSKQKGEVFALFVGSKDPLPKGVWLDATAGQEEKPSKTGRRKVKSSLGPLAYRPGWHAGDIPLATHIGAKDEEGNVFARKEDEVWAEVEMAEDVDYQPEANANGTTKEGGFSPALADIKYMPVNGLYRYKTNPAMTGNWIISGSMKINRILSENEVNSLLHEEDRMPWAKRNNKTKKWEPTNLNLKKWGLDENPAENQKKLLDVITYDDDGNIIPLSQRFDQTKSDVRYSVSSTVNTAHDLIQDLTKRKGPYNWFNKKFNTPNFLANKALEFKPFFNETMQWDVDVKRSTSRPADLAPNVLKNFNNEGLMKSAKFLIGKGEYSTEDFQQAHKALMMGTLWGGGNPLEGRLFTQKELLDGVTDPTTGQVIKLSPKQFKLYQEARKAVDASVTELTAAQAFRMVRNYLKNDDIVPILMDDPHGAREIISDALLNQIESLEEQVKILKTNDSENNNLQKLEKELLQIKDSYEKVQEIFQKRNDLIAHGYMPASRFGPYSITVIAPTTEGDPVRLVKHYDSEWEANIDRRTLLKEYDGFEIGEVKKIPKQQYELYRGMNPETVMMFADLVGIDDEAVKQEWYKNAISNNSALKHMVHRKGYAGYSNDLSRSLASFITSNGRYVGNIYHLPTMNEMIEAEYKKGNVEIAEQAQELKKFLEQDTSNNLSTQLRSLMASWYLLGSVASATVNATQPFTQTLPWLVSQMKNPWKAGMLLGKAYKDAKSNNLSKDEQQAMLKAAEQNITAPSEVYHLYSEGTSSLAKRIFGSFGKNVEERFKALMFIWGAPFSIIENINRKATFLAAYRLGKELGKDPVAFAIDAVTTTQGSYAKPNRVGLARNDLGSLAFTFKQFTITYLEQLYMMASNPQKYPYGKQAALLQLGILWFLGGLAATPLEEDAEDIIDSIMQATGHAKLSRIEIETKLRDVLSKELAQFVTDDVQLQQQLGKMAANNILHGVSSFLPIDVAGRFSAANIIPGTAVFKPSEQNPEKELAQFFGPAASFVTNALEGVRIMSQDGQFVRGMKMMLPRGITDMVKGSEMLATGETRTSKGEKVGSATPFESVAQMLGFNPQKRAEFSRAKYPTQEILNYRNLVEKNIVDELAEAFRANDDNKRQEALDTLKDWNEMNPKMGIKISRKQVIDKIKAKEESPLIKLAKTAPKEVRSSVSQMVQ